MLFTDCYTAKTEQTSYFNNQYRQRGFDVGIPCTE